MYNFFLFLYSFHPIIYIQLQKMSIFKNHYFIVFIILIFPMQFTYTRDWPQSLSTVLQQSPYKYTLSQISLLYTFTSLGLMLISFKLGAIFDKIPINVSLIVIPVINMLIQLAMAMLFYFNISYSYYLVLVCRIIFGVVGQSFFMLQVISSTRVFKQKATIYIGFGSSCGNLGSPLNSMITPILFDLKHNIFFPLFICFLTSVLYVGVGLILRKIVNQNEKEIKQQSKLLILSQDQSKSNTLVTKSQTTQILQKNASIAQKKKGLWIQIKELPYEYWIVLLFTFILIGNTIGFVAISYDLFVKRFGIQYDHANYLFVIPYTVGAISSFGWKKLPLSYRDCFICLGILLLSFNIALFFTPNMKNSTPQDYVYYIIFLTVIGICLGGGSMKVFSSHFHITKPENAGAIAGLSATVVSLMYLTVPFICSLIVNQFNGQQIGYKYLSLVFYIPLSLIILGLALYMKLSDRFEKLG